MKHLLIALALVMSWPSSSQAQEKPGGTMTILVRDTTGQRLAGVSVIVFYEDDLQGRIEQGRYTTDSRGEVVLKQLAWGTYVIQFTGQAPDGREIQPAAEQNMGMLDDGSGAANGFGVYFTEAERLEMYVLGTLPGSAEAVPLFDQADSAEASPEPYDPIIDMSNQGPTPTPYTLQEALQGRTAPAMAPSTRAANTGILIVLGLVLWLVFIGVLVGYLRSRRAQANDERRAE